MTTRATRRRSPSRFDVPAGRDAIANGVQTGHTTSNGRTIWTYRMAQPMATELTQLAVGDWDFSTPRRPRRRGDPQRDRAEHHGGDAGRARHSNRAQLDYMEAQVGAYPFDTYGSLVVNAPVGFAWRPRRSNCGYFVSSPRYGQAVWEPTMLHELSHMWFGDSVAPYSWSDLWLNEGHASWYEFTYAESRGELVGDTEGYPDAQGYATLDDLMRGVYAHGDEWRDEGGAGRAAEERRRAEALQSPASTTAARSSSTHCARRSGPWRSTGWSARGCSASRAAWRAPTISSPWPRRSPASRT